MKILYIHQYFSTPAGSVGTRSYEFGKRLVQAGHEVTMLCGESHMTNAPSEVEGIEVIQVPISCSNRDGFVKRAFSFFKFSLVATWYALRLDYDLVFASSTPLTVGAPGIAAKLLRCKKFIFEVRDLWPELPRAMGIITNPIALSLLDCFEKSCYRAADACVGLSPGIVDGIKNRCPEKRVELIPNGCDLEIFRKVETLKAESGRLADADMGANSENGAVSSFHLPPSTFSAIFCGAHGRANGLDAVLDAAAVLKQQQRCDIKLIFIGDGQLKQSLKSRAEEEGLSNCVFLDPVSKDDLAQLMQEVDLGLMILADIPAFRYGTSPNKFFDYLSSGLPVLCNYPGWVSDMIQEWGCGVSTTPGDADGFAAELIRLADQREALPAMGANARKLAEAEFNRDKLFERLHQLIQDQASPDAEVAQAVEI